MLVSGSVTAYIHRDDAPSVEIDRRSSISRKRTSSKSAGSEIVASSSGGNAGSGKTARGVGAGGKRWKRLEMG